VGFFRPVPRPTCPPCHASPDHPRARPPRCQHRRAHHWRRFVVTIYLLRPACKPRPQLVRIPASVAFATAFVPANTPHVRTPPPPPPSPLILPGNKQPKQGAARVPPVQWSSLLSTRVDCSRQSPAHARIPASFCHCDCTPLHAWQMAGFRGFAFWLCWLTAVPACCTRHKGLAFCGILIHIWVLAWWCCHPDSACSQTIPPCLLSRMGPERQHVGGENEFQTPGCT
jgi:hypothetical protein